MVPLTTSKIGCPIPSNLIAAKALAAGEGFAISTYSISEALTTQQLHMHRNNVLYRIGSIEKRFGIDLGQFGTRERLISYYRYKILTSNKFRQLLV